MSENRLKVRLKDLIPWVLAVMIAIVLAYRFPTAEILGEYLVQTILYIFLTAFALLFGVWLSEGALSPAHVVGMLAFLSLPVDAFPLLIWAMFIGGLAGAVGLIIYRRAPVGKSWRMRVKHLVFITARVTLSFFAAGQVYIVLNAPQPLESISWNQYDGLIWSILIYGLVYITVYFSIFVLEIYANARPLGQIIRTNLLLILIILLLPTPFAILNAEIADSLTRPSEIISLLGLVVIILGLHALSRSETQLRKQLNEMQTISIVTRSMRAHIQIESLLKAIFVQISQLLDVNNFTLVVYNEDHTRFDVSLVIRNGQEDSRPVTDLKQLDDYPLLQYVLDHATPLFIRRDVQNRAANLGLSVACDYIHSWIGVPLMVEGKERGMMAVASTRSNQLFSQSDFRLMNIVADSASIAIENAQLFYQQTQRVEQMIILNHIASLLADTLAPDTVLDTVISSASTISEANAVALYLFWTDTPDQLPLVRSAGLSTHFSDNAPEPLCLKFDNRQPLAIADIRKDLRSADLQETLIAENVRSMVELPLYIGEKTLGVLVMYFRDARVFSEDWLELMRAFATQASQAINNARTFNTVDEAFQRSVEQLLSLAGIGRELAATIDLEKICELILTHAIQGTHGEVGVVALFDESQSRLEIISQQGYPEDTFKDASLFEASISQMALQNGQIYRITNVDENNHYKRLIATTRSQLSVPILRGKETLGFITLESSRLAGFSAEDSHFVAQIANQAVIAIDNARLFKRITEARDRLQVILNAMEEALILIDRRGVVALVNPSLEMLMLKPNELLHQSVQTLLSHPESTFFTQLGFNSVSEVEKLLLGLKQGWGDYDPHLYVLQHVDGMKYIQRYIIPVRDEQQQIMGLLLVFYDKTEEQELDRAREELTRMIVHDLRSPLTAVVTSLRLLSDYVPKDNEIYPLVESTTDASRRAVRKLLGRVDTLLDIAKMQSGKINLEQDFTELAPIVQNVIAELKPLADELNITVVPELDENLPLLNIDEDKVERLLLNLVDNAIKYSPTNSEIHIRAYPMDDEIIRVDVLDNGPGVPDDYKTTLFDSFVQIEGRRNVRRGVGLGLSFCKLVVDAHHGKIWVEDNQPTGSIFAFTLPVAKINPLEGDSKTQNVNFL
ncbi:MAG: GAF domain-containing protein [Chloroflexi bacterium]|nr:MAG: GAF domain-containing protein [Chloroflexota bacterium]